jgi:hypothetical protein
VKNALFDGVVCGFLDQFVRRLAIKLPFGRLECLAKVFIHCLAPGNLDDLCDTASKPRRLVNEERAATKQLHSLFGALGRPDLNLLGNGSLARPEQD